MLMVYRPGAENLAVPIASYWDVTDPLTEEGVKMRRLAMSRCKTINFLLESSTRPSFTFKWKGQKRMYDGDDVSIWILTDVVANFDFQTWLTFSQ